MLDLSFSNFQFAAQWVSLKPTKGILPSGSGYQFTKRLIRVYSNSRSSDKIKISETWRKAGWLKQLDWTTHQELSSRIVPLNQDTVLIFPLVTNSYSLVFTPVKWLPNLTVKVYEYTLDDSAVLSDPTIALVGVI